MLDSLVDGKYQEMCLLHEKILTNQQKDCLYFEYEGFVVIDQKKFCQ